MICMRRGAPAFLILFSTMLTACMVPDDIKWLAPAVLEHRLILSPDADLHGVTQGDIVRDVLTRVPAPRAGG